MITRSPNQDAEAEAGLSVLMLRVVLCELLIGGDKLAGRERRTSAGCDDDVHLTNFGESFSLFGLVATT